MGGRKEGGGRALCNASATPTIVSDVHVPRPVDDGVAVLQRWWKLVVLEQRQQPCREVARQGSDCLLCVPDICADDSARTSFHPAGAVSGIALLMVFV